MTLMDFFYTFNLFERGRNLGRCRVYISVKESTFRNKHYHRDQELCGQPV